MYLLANEILALKPLDKFYCNLYGECILISFDIFLAINVGYH